MSAVTAVSRLTGFARVLVVAAVLGTTFLGNTYQTVNTIPNIVFELFAAGALGAILVPTLVEALRAESREAEEVAGSILGLLLVLLGTLALAGMFLAPWIARLLFAGVEDPDIRRRQIELGTLWLRMFLPQVLFYAGGLVATGVMNARNRFVLPAVAPAVNNVVVICAYVAFWWMRDGAEPSLDISRAESWVLAGGTTLAVVAFTSVPVIGLLRSGFVLRPRLDTRHRLVRRLARQGLWASAALACTQLLLLVVLVLANEIEGGVVAYQVGFTYFLLPHALLAIPAFTTLYPSISEHALDGDDQAFASGVRRGVLSIALLTLPAAAALAALALPGAKLTLFGASAGAGVGQVAAVTAAFAPGLLPYGVFLLLVRASYARGDARLPARAHLATLVIGVGAMLAADSGLSANARLAGFGLAHSLAYVAGAAVLLAGLRRKLPAGARLLAVRPLVQALVLAVASGLLMAGLSQAAGPALEGRAGAALAMIIGGGAGIAAFLAGARWLALPDPRKLLDGVADA